MENHSKLSWSWDLRIETTLRDETFCSDAQAPYPGSVTQLHRFVYSLSTGIGEIP